MSRRPPAAPLAASTLRCDPAFVLGAELGLRLSGHARDRVSPPETWRWLAMRVARQPQDLRAHLQRIRALTEDREPARLFGALVDLFLVLGDKGRALRAEMLASAGTLLDPEDHGWLQAHLEGGLGHDVVLPLTTGSVIARGAMGRTTLVTEVARPRPALDPALSDDPFDDPFHVPPGHSA